MEGLEPTHLAALDPKSSVSTNFTTSAFKAPLTGALKNDLRSIFLGAANIMVPLKVTRMFSAILLL